MSKHAENSGNVQAGSSTQVSAELSSFYSDWYSESVSEWAKTKRSLAAVDSVAHIHDLIGPTLGKLVDVGAGSGAVIDRLSIEQMFESASALEISPSGLAAINARNIPGMVRAEGFDGYKMPFSDDEFDTAICVHVIEHVEHERQFIRELGRIAKRIFIEIPLEGGMRGRVNRLYGHINYYTPPYFLNLLETSGMKPIAWKVFASSLAYEQHLYGPFKGLIRHALRSGILAVTGANLAPHLTTYLLAVACEKAE